jgi:hypothetical protein
VCATPSFNYYPFTQYTIMSILYTTFYNKYINSLIDDYYYAFYQIGKYCIF